MSNYFQRKIFMAAGDGGGGSGVAAGEKAGESSAASAAAAASTASTKTETAEGDTPTLTQKQVDGLMASAKKEGAEKLAKEYGFLGTDGKPDVKAFNEFVKAAKATEEAGKTETQREKDARTAAEAKVIEANGRAEKAEAKAAALEAGVDKAKVDKLLKLLPAYEGETMDAKIKAIVADFPDMLKPETLEVPNLRTQIKNQGTPAMVAADAQLDQVFGSRPVKK